MSALQTTHETLTQLLTLLLRHVANLNFLGPKHVCCGAVRHRRRRTGQLQLGFACQGSHFALLESQVRHKLSTGHGTQHGLLHLLTVLLTRVVQTLVKRLTGLVGLTQEAVLSRVDRVAHHAFVLSRRQPTVYCFTTKRIRVVWGGNSACEGGQIRRFGRFSSIYGRLFRRAIYRRENTCTQTVNA